MCAAGTSCSSGMGQKSESVTDMVVVSHPQHQLVNGISIARLKKSLFSSEINLYFFLPYCFLSTSYYAHKQPAEMDDIGKSGKAALCY